MSTSEQTFFNSVWNVSETHIHPSLRHLSVKAKPKDWRKEWSTRSSAEAYEMESHGENVYPRPVGRLSEGEGRIVYRIRWWYESRGLHQGLAHRCLNSPLSFDEKQKNMSWDDVINDDKEDVARVQHIRGARLAHFKRKRDDKIKSKKKRKNAWINKKASKKRRR